MDNDLISREKVLDIIRPRLNSAEEGTQERQRLYSVYLSVQKMSAGDAGRVIKET